MRPLLTASLAVVFAACAPDRPLTMSAPAPGAERVRVCGAVRGKLVALDGFVDRRTGDTLVAGQPLRQVFAAQKPAAGERWFQENRAVTFRGQLIVKYGLPASLRDSALAHPGFRRVRDIDGVEVFERKDQRITRCSGAVYYVPVTRGCVFQEYQVAEAMCWPARG